MDYIIKRCGIYFNFDGNIILFLNGGKVRRKPLDILRGPEGTIISSKYEVPKKKRMSMTDNCRDLPQKKVIDQRGAEKSGYQ